MNSNTFSSEWVSVAAQLFQERGYEETSLHHIAETVHRPIAELEQQHSCKASLALQIFRDLGVATQATTPTLPPGTVSRRYRHMMQAKLVQLRPHKDVISALFANAMRPNSPLVASEFSHGQHDPMRLAFDDLITGSTDAPRKLKDQTELATMLYTFHWLVILFWLYDRTEENRATYLMIDFISDIFKMVRPMMVMPLFGKAMTKLSQIMMLVFGGARLVQTESTSISEKTG